MVEDAEAAGFNPLTAIRNGGSAGFTTTSHPALSSGAFIAEALGQFGNIVSSYDPMAKATAELEHKIKQETLRNLQADTAQRLRASIGGVPVSTAAPRKAGIQPALAKQVPPTAGGTTVTNPLPARFGGEVNPGFVDAEAWETRYGDIAQEVGGLLNVGADIYWNLPPLGGALGRLWRGDDKRPRLKRAQ